MNGLIEQLKRERLPLLLLLLVTAALYARSLGFGFAWDDIALIKDNQVYRNLDIPAMFLALGNGVEYLPVRDLTFGLDFLLWGDNPAGFHLSNLVFFVLSVLAAYLAALALTQLLQPELERRTVVTTALITAGLFAVHPLHVEPVNFINARNALVSGLFFFLCLYAYLLHLDQGRKKPYYLSLAFFVLALFSKATVIVLPLLLGLLAVFKYGGRARRYLPGLLPFLAIATCGFLLFRAIGHQTNVIPSEQVISLQATGLEARVATALQVPFFYLQKFVWPAALSVDYSPGFSIDLLGVKPMASAAAIAIVFFLAYLGRKRFPEGLFGFCAYLILLLPVMNFFLTNPLVADRYAHLPVFALAFVSAAALSRSMAPGARTIVSIILCAALAMVAYDRSRVWKSDEILWRSTLADNPESYLGLVNLASNLSRRDEADEVRDLLDRLSEIRTSDILLDAFLAKQDFKQGNYEKAIERIEKALLMKEPSVDALYFLANAYEKTGQTDRALLNYRKTVYIRSVDAYGYKEQARKKIRELEPVLVASLQPLIRAVEENPGSPQAKADLATRFDAAGLDNRALQLYLELDREYPPNWAVLANIGTLYLESERYREAVEYFSRSIELNERNPEVQNGLGLALKGLDRYAEAEQAFLKAMIMAPDYRNAPYNLALLYFRIGRLDEARRYFEYTAERFPGLSGRAQDYLSRLKTAD